MSRTLPKHHGRPSPYLMTRAEFERFIVDSNVRVYVPWPYLIVACGCGDCNCHGWRFVEVRE